MLTKFLILPEKGESDFFNLLPLVSTLLKEYPDSEINVVHSENFSYQFKGILPRVKFHFFQENQLGPVSSLKVAEQMVEVFNIDFLLNYRTDVGALHLGKAFSAKNRLGWKSLVNDLFLTSSFKTELNAGPAKYLSLWNNYLKRAGEKSFIGFEKEVSPENFFKVKEVEPFLFLPMRIEEDTLSLLKFMSSFFKQVESIRKIYWFPEGNSYTEDFSKESFNKVVDASGVDPKDVYHYILHCQGVLTNIPWISSLCSYMQVENVFFKNPKNSQDKLPNTEFFKLAPTGIDYFSSEKFDLLLEEEKKPLEQGALIEEISNWFRI